MKKNILIVIGIALIIIIGLTASRQGNRSQDVTIDLASPAKLELFAAVENEDDLQKTGSVLQTISTTTTFSLKKGTYVLIPSGSEYDPTPIGLTVADEPVTKIIDIPYNAAYLQGLLTTENSAVEAAMRAAYPKISGYTINPGQLFDRGEWYGTTLASNGTVDSDRNGDTLRIVLHKENNNWTVVTKPPAIIIDKVTYKDVPLRVLQAVNKL